MPPPWLELTTSDQPENMSPVVHHFCTDLMSRISHLLKRRREEENRLAEQRQLRLSLTNQRTSRIYIRLHAVDIPRIGDKVQPANTYSTHPSV